MPKASIHTVNNISPVQEYKTLDPVLLGRPVQALEAMATKLAQQVQAQIQSCGHRPIALAIEAAHFCPATLNSSADLQQHRITMARATVQACMAERYGFTAQAGDISSEDAPCSATEQRITKALHEAAQTAIAKTLPNAIQAGVSSSQIWIWQAQIRVAQLPTQMLHIRLSTTASHALEGYLAAQRKPSRPHPASNEPLEVDLQALLLEKTVSAADIYQLQVGSVLPIALDRARVLLNGQAMLSASVAEHQGKLHLTAFENLD